MFAMDGRTDFLVKKYSVAALIKSYLNVIGIIMQSLKSIGQF